jgi:hypothetical protein
MRNGTIYFRRVANADLDFDAAAAQRTQAAAAASNATKTAQGASDVATRVKIFGAGGAGLSMSLVGLDQGMADASNPNLTDQQRNNRMAAAAALEGGMSVGLATVGAALGIGCGFPLALICQSRCGGRWRYVGRYPGERSQGRGFQVESWRLVRLVMDQLWVLTLPILGGILMIGTSLNMYRNGERWLKGSVLLRAFGPGVVTAPIGLGVSLLLFPVAYVLWPVVWARDLAMALLLITFMLGWLSFAWSPKRVLPTWLRPMVRTPIWMVAITFALKRILRAGKDPTTPAR